VFGDLVRMYRRRRGLTQEELAERVGINVRTIGKIEASRIVVPRPATMVLLADAFELAGDERERFYDAASDPQGASDPQAAAEPQAQSPAAGPGDGERPDPPAQLPANVAGFVGRGEQLDQLSDLLDQATEGESDEARAVVITAIGGTAGVGKTALAVRWAHRVRPNFPDGQLYVNLRGYDPDEPMPATDALAGFLRALGFASPGIPPTLDERAAAYRTLLTGRRVLLVLDNASSEEQIRPLLPGTSSCVVVVTSRDSLSGLVARDGAVRVPVDVLSLADSVALLRALIGRRVDEDTVAAAALAQRCARLPLALRVAAEVAASRPTVPLADLVAELADEHAHLQLFDGGTDDRTRVPVVFSWSYRGLPPDAGRLFRLCGLPPAAQITPYAAAALADTSVDYAGVLLDLLVRAHLADQTAPDRYAMHDLLRAYAAQVAATDEVDGERQAALTRLFDHYLVTAAQATEALHPGEGQRRPVIPAAMTAIAPVAERAQARAWLDGEISTLATIATYTATHGWPDHAIRLSAVLYRHLNVSGQPESFAIHRAAAEAARRTGDRAAEGAALIRLGLELGRRGAITEAEQSLRAGIELARQAGDAVIEGMGVGGLAIMCWFLGRYSDTAELLQQGLELHRRSGDIVGQSAVLQNLGSVHFLQGRWQASREHLTAALALAGQIGFRDTEVNILCGLAELDIHEGKFDAAAEWLDRAKNVAVAMGDRMGQAAALRDLGFLRLRQGRVDEAVEPLTAALEVYESLGIQDSTIVVLSRLGEARRHQGDHEGSAELLERVLKMLGGKGDVGEHALALNRLGMTRLAMGRFDDAASLLTQAITVSLGAGMRYPEANARAALAEVHGARGQPGPAVEELRQALALYEELQAPEATAARARLATLRQTAIDDPFPQGAVSTSMR
jgi:tetratricopeptide (TPR) repeat protein/transcriptional regulator with XRE-family HTH domain